MQSIVPTDNFVEAFLCYKSKIIRINQVALFMEH
jgi:hypothetical protein